MTRKSMVVSIISIFGATAAWGIGAFVTYGWVALGCFACGVGMGVLCQTAVFSLEALERGR